MLELDPARIRVRARPIEITIELGEASITVDVSDDGPGFERTPAAHDDEQVDEGGLGLSIIEAVCDDVEIGPRSNGTGSHVRFARRRDDRESVDKGATSRR